jgi:hypothetical protein
MESMSGTKLNYTAILFYTVLLIVIVLVCFYLFNIFHFKTTVTALISNLKLPSINLNGIFKWISENTVVAGVIASLGTTVIGVLIKNWQTNKLLNASTEEAMEAKIALTQKDTAAQKKISELEQQVETLNGDTAAEELQKRLGEVTDKLNTSEITLRSVQRQNQELMDRLENQEVKIVKVPV